MTYPISIFAAIGGLTELSRFHAQISRQSRYL